MNTDKKRGVVLISVLLIVLILSGISVSLGEIFLNPSKGQHILNFNQHRSNFKETWKVSA